MRLTKQQRRFQASMQNKVRIRPLLQYEVSYYQYIDGKEKLNTDTFTGDDYESVPGRTVFYRTGNVIREYQRPILDIVVSPVDDEDTADIQE